MTSNATLLYKTTHRKRYVITKLIIKLFNEALCKIEWEKELQDKSVDKQCTFFKESITKIIDKYVPSKTLMIKLGKRRQVPCDAKALDKISEKHHLRRKAIASKDPPVQVEYDRVRNQIRRLTRKITKEYEKGLARDKKENTKAIWKYINSKSKKNKEGIGNLLKDPSDKNFVIVETDKEKAEELAEYFSSVFTKEPPGPTQTLDNCKIPTKLMMDWN